MRKTALCLLLLLAVSSIALMFPPNVSSQAESVKILDYTYRFDSSGILVAVGEIQNTGSSILSMVIVSGTATTSYGTEVLSGDIVWARNLLPGQKAPFYVEFRTNTTSTGAWTGGLSDLSIKVLQVSSTADYQYQDIEITTHQSTQTASGEYSINGELKNTGSQTANNVAVVATFYNSEGKPIAAGYSPRIATIAPEGINSFSLSAFNLNQTYVGSDKKVSSYALMVQADSPLLNGTVPPAPTPITGPGSEDNLSNTGNNLSSVYIAGFVVVVVVVVVVLFLLTRRRPVKLASSKPKNSSRQTHNRKRRKR